MTNHVKTAPEAATSETAKEQLETGSTATAYIARWGHNTRDCYGTWGGAQLPMKDHIAVILPITAVQRIRRDGTGTITINDDCAANHSREVRRRREEAQLKAREDRIQKLRARVSAEEFGDALAAADKLTDRIYEKIDARVEQILAQEQVIDDA